MRRSLSGGPPAPRPAFAPDREQVLASFERFLASRGLRLTAARRAIVEAVVQRTGHFDLDDLVDELKRRGIRGSRATIYRALPLLTAAGLLQEAVATPRTRSFECAAGGAHHDHLVCTVCGKVVEFRLEAFDALERHVAGSHGFRLDGHHHQLLGVCAECLGASPRQA